MCGIVGYTGNQDATQVLLDGLKRLEYRGYDSSGIAVDTGERIELRRALGKLATLHDTLTEHPVEGLCGIGHTRWATHGRPCVANAHPHRAGGTFITHNGIIENHAELRARLEADGHKFASETDSEVIAHLIERAVRAAAGEAKLDAGATLVACVHSALAELTGSYAIAVMNDSFPAQIVAAKRGGSPLVIAHTSAGTHLASDIPALLPYSRDVVALEDGELARLTPEGFELFDADGRIPQRTPKRIDWDPISAEKGGYDHFMLKEIFEQPAAVSRTLAGRIAASGNDLNLEELPVGPEEARRIRRLYLVGCGTAFYACMLGKAWIERLAGIPAEAVRASEFRYGHPVLGPDTWLIPVSQSGETADTLAAVELARAAGGRVSSICNVRDASIPRASDHVLYTQAGPEIGVASTKAFTTQLLALFLVAVRLARAAGRIDDALVSELLDQLQQLPDKLERALAPTDQIRAIAERYHRAHSFLFVGRELLYPIALEGALKLKEISYIHAEGYAGGELKHGPIALIDHEMPSVVLALRTALYDKICSNLEQIRSRDGKIIAIGSEGDGELLGRAHDVLYVPQVGDLLSPIVATLPLQLLAYHIAVLKGTDVDQPRNLAKSVTVE